jgi:hypothetical protein
MAAGNDNMPLPKAKAYWNLELIPQSDRDLIDSIIFVGASTKENKRCNQFNQRNYGPGTGSTYGPIVDLFAPGHDIISATHSPGDNSSWDKDSGSSFVSPDNKGTLITTNSPQLHHTLRRLLTSLESSHVCSATFAIEILPHSR